MKKQLVYGLVIALAPVVGSAESLLDEVTEGAADVTKTVGNAATSVSDTVESTNKSLRDGATPEQTRAKLDEMAKKTLARLLKEHPDSPPLFEHSAGYAVFDAREASFYVAAGYGRGVAVNRETEAHTYMKMATAGAELSFGIGGFERQLVILFENAADLKTFENEGFDTTAEAGAMVGEEKDELAVRFNEGKAMFVLTKKGWKVSAKLTGTRYWPDEELNQN